MPATVEHNHELKQPENGELFHPDSDPRVLQDMCPACKEIMQQWAYKIQELMDSGA